MAGMLPGVEAARIRRFHQSNLNNGGGGSGGSARRSFFCLYATNYQDFHITSRSSMARNCISPAVYDDENLEAAAREAKNRLDRRLQKHWKSQVKRKQKAREGSTSVEGTLRSEGHLQTNVCISMWKSGYQSG